MKNVIVASHRRAGTHLTIDSIINNFEVFNGCPAIDDATLDHLSSHLPAWPVSLAEFKARTGDRPCIFKTHSHGMLRDFFQGSREVTEYIDTLFDESKLIYVHRDGRDLMTSLFHYQRSFDSLIENVSFDDFIAAPNPFDRETYEGEMDRVSYWVFHVDSWLRSARDCLELSFDDFQNDYPGTIDRIAAFIDEPAPAIPSKTVRSPERPKPKRGLARIGNLFNKPASAEVKYSSVCFRKGVSGGWQEQFSEDSLAFFQARGAELNHRLGY